MIAIITAKLAKMRWRNVQFFTVSPRCGSKCGEYSRGRCFIYKTVTHHVSSRCKSLKNLCGEGGAGPLATAQWLGRRIEVIQCPGHGQFTEHDELLNTGFAWGVFEGGRVEVMVEGAVGGIVELFLNRVIRRGCRISFRQIGRRRSCRLRRKAM